MMNPYIEDSQIRMEKILEEQRKNEKIALYMLNNGEFKMTFFDPEYRIVNVSKGTSSGYIIQRRKWFSFFWHTYTGDGEYYMWDSPQGFSSEDQAKRTIAVWRKSIIDKREKKIKTEVWRGR